jgi:hypothetical protein
VATRAKRHIPAQRAHYIYLQLAYIAHRVISLANGDEACLTSPVRGTSSEGPVHVRGGLLTQAVVAAVPVGNSVDRGDGHGSHKAS